MKKNVGFFVYGATILCPSCVNMPSSKDTEEWLRAAIGRKFPDQLFSVTYIDIYSPPEDDIHLNMAHQIIEEDLFYPVVVVDNEILTEGQPRLKKVYRYMEDNGYTPVSRKKENVI